MLEIMSCNTESQKLLTIVGWFRHKIIFDENSKEFFHPIKQFPILQKYSLGVTLFWKINSLNFIFVYVDKFKKW